MNKLVLIFSILFSVLSAQAKLEFNANYPLYASDGTKYGFDQVHLALDQAFSFGKPVIIYIHGRGDEPLKSIEGKPLIGGATIPAIERDYNARAILFNWDAQGLLLDRKVPLSHVPDAVESFKKVIDQIKTYDVSGKKLILAVHSMGSIVVQNYILKYGWKTHLFSNILFTEPDADNLNHKFWLDQIAAVENVYMTINNDDVILGKSTDERPVGAAALGLKPTADISSLATYLDYTMMGEKVGKETKVHEIFDKTNMKFHVPICQAFDQILTGLQPGLTEMNSVKPNYLKFQFRIDKNDHCFSL